MSISGTRGLIRVAHNPECELQAAMALERVKEPDFYRRITGQEFPGEYGERMSARRRGAQFEASLHRNNAALLRQALAPRYGLDPEEMTVRNLAEEVPGTGPAKQALRLQRTRAILRDLAAGKPVPHLIIQPQLRIAVGANSADAEYIGPDFVVLDPRAGIYVPGEEKSFIVRDNVAAPSDLDTARRQAAAQIIALRGEMQPLGLDGRVMNRAVFIFATPFGLRPSPPFEETLDAEVFEITRALQVLATIRQRLDRLRAASDTPLEQIAGDLQINYQEHCVSSCILATVCKRRCDGQAAQLGEAAGDLLGPATDVRRAIALLDGAPPVTPQEAALAERLIDAAAALGQLPARQRRSA